uniref:Uncharacterized protein n=1 Tax=Octactis speculum TaxID=3111310 RepID=A0A7S2MEU6_9STRA|mmetsp:Transcript_60990/g.83746  ORF Transcript_60990/g.83746 Transcript_60990/m.83746 type:complete len:187 (+) Transcript_60990:100-660(+)
MPNFESFTGDADSSGRWQESPVYDVSTEELKDSFFRMVESQYSIPTYAKPTLSDEANLQFVFVQRTKIFRFPDVVNVQFISLDEGSRSTIIMHSGSVYGASDFGKNRERVQIWLGGLDTEVGMKGTAEKSERDVVFNDDPAALSVGFASDVEGSITDEDEGQSERDVVSNDDPVALDEELPSDVEG